MPIRFLPSRSLRHRSVLIGVALAAACLSASCRVHDVEHDAPPRTWIPSKFERASGTADERAEQASTAWWKSFDNPHLNQLIDHAFAFNQDLLALHARVRQADALLRRSGARLLPALDARGDYDYRFESSDDHSQSCGLGLDLSWEVDLWKRLESAERARELEASAARDDFRALRLLLAAAITQTYFEIQESLEQIGLLTGQIEINETFLDLKKLRFGQGLSSVVDVLQQREQLASTRALLPIVEGRLEELESVLATLLGTTHSDEYFRNARPIEDPPALPSTGVPADLLVHRPDLRAAHDRLVAADYRVAEAVADRFPRLRIGAGAGFGGVPRLDTVVASAFAGLVAPLYDAGTRRAEADLRRARVDEALADYSQRFVTAVHEVESASILERKQAEHVERQTEQLAIARELLVETRHRYSQGLTDYLPVLTAIATVQELERDLLTSRRRRLGYRVALQRALGGSVISTMRINFFPPTFKTHHGDSS